MAFPDPELEPVIEAGAFDVQEKVAPLTFDDNRTLS
jgi:hypothetical protein